MAPPDDSHRQRLADLVKRRRTQLQLSTVRAAQEAKLSRQTWQNLESAARRTNPANHTAIERVLRWAPGSVAAILDGGDPTEVTGQPTSPGQGPTLGERIAAINALPLPLWERLAAIDELVAAYRQAGLAAGANDGDQPPGNGTRTG
jgi:DNA-binding XRE family transcriptional regulator